MNVNPNENRTLQDIMEDYDPNEWETLLVVNENGCARFRHRNGKDFFCKQYQPKENNEYTVDEKMLRILSGKTVEQQMEYFYVTTSIRTYSTAYGEQTAERLRKTAVKLYDYEGVKQLLLKNNVLIGAIIEGNWGDGVLLPEKSVCVYYASDNDGAGTKERADYAYLIFSDIDTNAPAET